MYYIAWSLLIYDGNLSGIVGTGKKSFVGGTAWQQTFRSLTEETATDGEKRKNRNPQTCDTVSLSKSIDML